MKTFLAKIHIKMKKRKSAVEIFNQRDNNCSSLPNFLKGYISDNLGSKK